MLLRVSLFQEGRSAYVSCCVSVRAEVHLSALLAPFLEKRGLGRAQERFADFLFAPKHAKADVLLTTVLGVLRRLTPARHRRLQTARPQKVASTITPLADATQFR